MNEETKTETRAETKPNKLLAWTSIKTTAGDCRPLEIAVFITELEDPYAFRGKVSYAIEMDETEREEIESAQVSRGGAGDIVPEIFYQNGLVSMLGSTMAVPMEVAEKEVIEFMSRFGEPGDFILAGRGVHVNESVNLAIEFYELGKWYDKQTVFDLSSVSYAINLAGLSEELEPRFPEPPKYRAYSDVERYWQEFQLYTQVLHAIPLTDEG